MATKWGLRQINVRHKRYLGPKISLLVPVVWKRTRVVRISFTVDGNFLPKIVIATVGVMA